MVSPIATSCIPHSTNSRSMAKSVDEVSTMVESWETRGMIASVEINSWVSAEI